MATPSLRLCCAVMLAAAVYATAQAAMKVTTQADKTFDFSKVGTWRWNEALVGKVIMARTADDDPEVVRQRAEPIIVDAVASELAARGIRQAPGVSADVTAIYYLLITLTSNAQTVGQFLPSTLQWGLPPISAATQSLRTVEQGSLVLDFNVGERLVWRGVANAELKPGQPQEKRRELLLEAVREIVKRVPRKK
jgi:Domain of unknown function (DUF4136)